MLLTKYCVVNLNNNNYCKFINVPRSNFNKDRCSLAAITFVNLFFYTECLCKNKEKIMNIV